MSHKVEAGRISEGERKARSLDVRHPDLIALIHRLTYFSSPFYLVVHGLRVEKVPIIRIVIPV